MHDAKNLSAVIIRLRSKHVSRTAFMEGTLCLQRAGRKRGAIAAKILPSKTPRTIGFIRPRANKPRLHLIAIEDVLPGGTFVVSLPRKLRGRSISSRKNIRDPPGSDSKKPTRIGKATSVRCDCDSGTRPSSSLQSRLNDNQVRSYSHVGVGREYAVARPATNRCDDWERHAPHANVESHVQGR